MVLDRLARRQVKMTTGQVPTRTSDEPARSGAVGLARAIRAGETTAREAVEACIGRIEAFDPAVNAVVLRRFARAREEADRADAQLAAGHEVGLLHGVPITIKDQFDIAGLPTTVGLASRRDAVAGSDGPLVGCLRKAGAIVLGKTNVFQLLVGWESDNPIFGRTNNPWDLARTPGGSSGGEAAVLAYGGSMLGLGGDFGGSVRVPAAFCGVCGLKPTAHRLTLRDTPPEPFGKQQAVVAQPGPMATMVQDIVLAMEVLAARGSDVFDPSVPPVMWGDPPKGVTGVGVGWFDDNGLFAPSPAIRRAVRQASEILAHGGARIVPIRPPDAERTTRLFLQLVGAARFRTERSAARGEKLVPALKQTFMAARMPGALKRALSGGTRSVGWTRFSRVVSTPMSSTPHDYFQRLDERQQILTDMMAAWDEAEIDVAVSPVYALPAPLHGTTGDLVEATSYTLVANLFGLPAGTVPVSRVQADGESDRPNSRDPADRLAKRVEQNSAGLPVGVQVIGRPWREDLVLATMAAIERGASERGSPPVLPVRPRD
jgi:fatty acid amide hydrolase